MQTANFKTQTSIDVNEEVRLDVSVEKTADVAVSKLQSRAKLWRNGSKLIFGVCGTVQNLGITVIFKNVIQEETNRNFISSNSCHH
jgi:hypothetical protein